MSTGYEHGGRSQQKQRTRGALLEAARRLLAEGTIPTVDDAAAAAAISRTTAYRYFSTQSALLLEAQPELIRPSLLPDEPPAEVAARVDLVVAELLRLTLGAETPLRAMLRLSLAPDHVSSEQLALRRGRAIAWLEEALAPLDLSPGERRALAMAIRSAVGLESLVWLVDVAGLDREQAVELQRWSARALLEQARRDPPPARKRR
jgi:AcrR family transcriptional regulator